MKNVNKNGSEVTGTASIQKQIIERAISRLYDNSLFDRDMLSRLDSESLSEPWCNLEQLDEIVNPVKQGNKKCE